MENRLKEKLRLIRLVHHVGRNEHVYESDEPMRDVPDADLIRFADNGNGSLGGIVQRTIKISNDGIHSGKWMIHVDVYTD